MSHETQQIVETSVLQVMELSVDEVALIQERRSMQAEQDEERAFQQKAIATTAEYGHWLSMHGAVFSYETFVKSFGYQGDDSKAMFATVQRIYVAARPLATMTKSVATGVAVDDSADGAFWPSQFLVWLRTGLSSGLLSINTKASLVHRVPEGIFLLAPAIFKLCLERHGLPEDSHIQLSRRLARLRCHLRNGDLNIHNYALNRKDRDTKLNGWVFPVDMFFSAENPAPAINNHLIRL